MKNKGIISFFMAICLSMGLQAYNDSQTNSLDAAMESFGCLWDTSKTFAGGIATGGFSAFMLHNYGFCNDITSDVSFYAALGVYIASAALPYGAVSYITERRSSCLRGVIIPKIQLLSYILGHTITLGSLRYYLSRNAEGTILETLISSTISVPVVLALLQF